MPCRSKPRISDSGAAERRAGKHRLRAHHHRGVGQPPGVGVEHRHHRHHRVGMADAQHVRERGGERVQHRAAVRVHHALRLPRGPRRVAHAAGVAFGEARRGPAAGRGSEERLVLASLCGRDHHHSLDGHARADLLPERQQHLVHQEEAIVRVPHDERQLLGREAEVQRVHHASGQWHAEVGLEVRGVVPHQRGHPVAGAEACSRQCLGQRPCPPRDLPVAGPVQRAIRQPRHHGDRGEHPLGADQEVVQRQRVLHHRAERGHGPDPRTDRACDPRSQRADVEPIAGRASSSR